jgi:hypothetical protein
MPGKKLILYHQSFSMKKQFSIFILAAMASLFFSVSCSNKDTNPPAPKTKTELLTQASWKFKSITANGADASSYIQACQRDNILIFSATGGNGTVDEGPAKCNTGDPQTNPFTWSFASGETVINISTPLFTNGGTSLTLISLTETELVVSVPYVPPVGPTVLLVITFQH